MTIRRAQTRNAKLALPATSSHRLLSSHTITWIASWRGQLLICTVVLVLGAIYFVVREPVGRWRRRRRERISRVRGEELLSMEKDEAAMARDDRDCDGIGNTATSSSIANQKTARERGRERRKETKKRRGSLLRIPNGTGSESSVHAPSSVDSSPAPFRVLNAVSLLNAAYKATGPKERDASGEPSNRAGEAGSAFTITLESSSSDVDTSTASEYVPQRHKLSEPWRSLPSPSPVAGPCQATQQDEDMLSADGDIEGEIDSDMRNRLDSDPSSRPSFTSVFSIMPDDSYLPASQSNNKKKKRKPKLRTNSEDPQPSEPLMPSALSMVKEPRLSSGDLPPSPGPEPVESTGPPTPRYRRRLSIGLPMSPALDLLLDNHERTIDSLRAEIGHAKAEESKAREDEVRAREDARRSKATEERTRSDYDRVRKARDRAESDTRRVELELQAMRNRFETLSHMYHAVCGRLRDVELGDGGSTSPGGIAVQSSARQHLHAVSPSRLSHSPYLPYLPPGSMPGTPIGGYVPYPSPGMYPTSAMLHPHGIHSHVIPSSPYRRSSGPAPSSDFFAGPLSPGHLSFMPTSTPAIPAISSPYPSDMSSVPSSLPAPDSGTVPLEMENAELRRLSIASSVLKKKSQTMRSSDSDDSGPNFDRVFSVPLHEVDESPGEEPQLEGLGIGSLNGVSTTFPSADAVDINVSPDKAPAKFSTATSTQSSLSSPSNPASPSPVQQSLITPSDAELFQRSGAHAPEPLSQLPAPEMTDIPCVHDPSGGNVYVRENGDNGSALDAVFETAVKLSRGFITDEPVDDTEGGDFAPMFASLAHTPEQLEEIALMREEAIRERERRKRMRSASANDL